MAEGWAAVRYFFPYFEEAAVDWDEQLVTALRRAAMDRTKADFLVTLRRLIYEPVSSTRLEVPVRTGPGPEAVAWEEKRWTLDPVAPRLAQEVAFLAGGGTISYGETLLDIIDTYERGVIVGATSAGTNGTVVEMKLPGGVTISWTGIRVRRPDGARLFGVGIPPAVRAAPTAAGLAAGRDEVLDRAIDEIAR